MRPGGDIDPSAPGTVALAGALACRSGAATRPDNGVADARERARLGRRPYRRDGFERILVSAEGGVDLSLALRRVDDFIEQLGLPIEVLLLYIGPPGAPLVLPNDGQKREILYRQGPVAETILETARRVSADITRCRPARRAV